MAGFNDLLSKQLLGEVLPGEEVQTSLPTPPQMSPEILTFLKGLQGQQFKQVQPQVSQSGYPPNETGVITAEKSAASPEYNPILDRIFKGIGKAGEPFYSNRPDAPGMTGARPHTPTGAPGSFTQLPPGMDVLPGQVAPQEEAPAEVPTPSPAPQADITTQMAQLNRFDREEQDWLRWGDQNRKEAQAQGRADAIPGINAQVKQETDRIHRSKQHALAVLVAGRPPAYKETTLPNGSRIRTYPDGSVVELTPPIRSMDPSRSKNPAWEHAKRVYDENVDSVGPVKAMELSRAAHEEYQRGLANAAARGAIEGQMTPAPGGTGLGLKAQLEADVTKARVDAQLGSETLQGADRTKFQMLGSAARQTDLVSQLYKPEYVGKGFQLFNTNLRSEVGSHEEAAKANKYVPGALMGGLRMFFGNASPEEVTFRRAIADVSDMLLRARSGAQINEQEYQRLKNTLFNLSDEPATFLPSLYRFQVEVYNTMKDTVRFASTPAKDLMKGVTPPTPTAGTATGGWSIKKRGQ